MTPPPSAPSPATGSPGAAKKPYQPPELTALGDLRDLTMGPSPGIGESGNPVVFRI
jgi:hypothetical protein